LARHSLVKTWSGASETTVIWGNAPGSMNSYCTALLTSQPNPEYMYISRIKKTVPEPDTAGKFLCCLVDP